LRLRLETTAVAIDPDRHEVTAVPSDRIGDTATHGATAARAERIGYDRLVLATGARPIHPPIDGLELPGVHVLHTVDQALAVHADLATARRAVVVGAGYIGVELVDALTHRGLEVSVVEMASQVLTTVDPPFGALVRAEFEQHGVTVRTGTEVHGIAHDGAELTVSTNEDDVPADVVVVAAGVAPNTDLAATLGVPTGAGGALAVDPTMATGVADVFAVPGSLGSQVVKVFDRVVARTGLDDTSARTAGYRPRTIQTTVDDHKAYYPGATDLHLRLTADTDGRLLGAQAVGHVGAEVAKRVDVVATAIHAGPTVDELSDLDLTYTPPLCAPWDPVQQAGQSWTAAPLRGDIDLLQEARGQPPSASRR
jgi:NADPH-dependent 2,4-dienoyl-CoA reductase/sulfur reductase-like enzyme